MAVVASNRETPGSATGISQTGIYVGAGAGPAGFGVLYAHAGHEAAWLAVAGMTLIAAVVMWLAARADERVRAVQTS
jgi:predicted MFS family arabinose efflux permease